jgi:uncharacterized integral membrane protein
MNEPGQQWFWKVTLTILCAVVGGILMLWFAGAL